MSRKVSTCFSGITSRCTSAWGLMSLIATNPFALRTYVPSLTMLQKRQSSRCDGKDALLGHGLCTNLDERADRSVDEEGGVVVPVAAAGPVDENGVERADLRVPPAQLELARQRPQPRAAVLLEGRGYRVVCRGDGARPRRVREDVHLRH